MSIARLVAVALFVEASVAAAEPIRYELPKPSRRRLELCSVAQVPNAVVGKVLSWSEPEYRHVTGYDDRFPFSVVNLQVLESLKGKLRSGSVNVLVYMGVVASGESVEGSLDSAVSHPGVFFLAPVGEELVLVSDGYLGPTSQGGFRTKWLEPREWSLDAIRDAIRRAGTTMACSDPAFAVHK